MRALLFCGCAVLVFASTSGALVAGEARGSASWRLDKAAMHDGLSSPVGMAYDAAGALYVANWSAGNVIRFSPKGARTIFASGLSGPSGLAISRRGDIYVASYNEDLVWRFTPAGDKSIFVSGLATPAGLSFDTRGRLLIANRRTNQVLAAHPDGKVEVIAEGLQTPVGAVELPGGDLLVSNIDGGIALVPAPDVSKPAKAIRAKTINSDLSNPGPGIVAAGPDAAYVVDYGGTTVSQVDRNGRRTVIADGLRSPVGLALAPDGSLTVATWGANAAFKIRHP